MQYSREFLTNKYAALACNVATLYFFTRQENVFLVDDCGNFPADTLRKNDVVITSKRRHCDVITSQWRRFDVITTSLLRHVFRGFDD